MKVYVLMYHGCGDYEDCMSCNVFKSLSSAQEQMRREFDSEVEEYKKMFVEDDEITTICESRYCAVYEMGDYTRNHSVWEIVEKDVC